MYFMNILINVKCIMDSIILARRLVVISLWIIYVMFQVCDENSEDMVKMLEKAFSNTQEAFSTMTPSTLSLSQTCKVDEEKVVAKALEMFEPILTQFANSLTNKVLDMSDQVTNMIHEKLNQSSLSSNTVHADL